MKKVNVKILDTVYRRFFEFAKGTGRSTDDLICEALAAYRLEELQRSRTHSVLDIKSFALGPVLKPWKSRAEMLEGFLDRREETDDAAEVE
jgi:hypothetical protein